MAEHPDIHERDELVKNEIKEGLQRLKIEALTEIMSYHILILNFRRRVMTEIELQDTEQPSSVSFAMILAALITQWATFALNVLLKSQIFEKRIAVFVINKVF